jgi:hypothetical protein
MKLYAVKVGTVAMVAAESESEAIRIARDNEYDILNESLGLKVQILGTATTVEEAHRLSGYSEDDPIYHAGINNITVREALDERAADKKLD